MEQTLRKAKKINSNEWVEGYLFYSFTGVPYIMTIYDHILNIFEYCEVNEKTICRNVGLSDMNEEPIWENDVVKVGDTLYTVKWDKKDAMFVLDDGSVIEGFHNISNKSCEVYGSIIDNPRFIDESENDKEI